MIPARKIRSSHAWRMLAKQVIKEEPLCYLRLPGCTRVSTTADHIIPAAIRPDLALIRSNTRGACKSCNYRRQDTPISQLAKLRTRTAPDLDKRARRHIAARRRQPAAAVKFFDTHLAAPKTRMASER